MHPMNKKLIAREWETFRQQALPANAPDLQVQTAKESFYAGALTLFQMLQRNLSADPETVPSDVELLEDVNQELLEFLNEYMRQYVLKQ